MTQLRQKKEQVRSAGRSGEERKPHADLARNIRRDIQESASNRARCAATLRASLQQLKLRKGPAHMQEQKAAEEELLQTTIRLLMCDQTKRQEKTPGWMKLLGQC